MRKHPKTVTITSMKNERGSLNILLIPFIFTIIFFLAAAGFGVWAYMERQDYKDNSDKKSAAAVAVAVDRTKSEKDNEFIQKEKEPLKPYKGPEALGSINFMYPKTWSTYVTTAPNQMTLISYPDYVTGGTNFAYALRVEVVAQAYDVVTKTYDNDVKAKKVTASAYALPKLPSVVGVRLDGAITQDKQGSVVILPLRDKTLKISAEANQFVGDFNRIILPNFTFSP